MGGGSTVPRPKVYPTGLDVRGKRLWRDVTEARPDLGPGERVMLEEACRMADRLEALDQQIRGAGVATIETEDGKEFTLYVTGAMAEARLAVTALRGVMMTLGLDRRLAPPAPPQPQPAPAGPEPDDGAPTSSASPSGDPIVHIVGRRPSSARASGA